MGIEAPSFEEESANHRGFGGPLLSLRIFLNPPGSVATAYTRMSKTMYPV
jgi:hypothetical protein